MELYTVKEVADKLRVKPVTVYKWIREGKLQAYKLSKKVIRVSEIEIERLLKGRT